MVPLARRTALAAVTLLALGGAAACGSSDDTAGAGSGSSGDKVGVVAAFYPLQFITQQVGGDAVSVTNLVKPGAEPHDLELNPQQVAQVADAKLVVYIKGFQPALDKAVSQNAAGRGFDVTTVSPLTQQGSNHQGTQEEGEPPAPDPHLWLDPTRLAAVADKLADRLAEVDSGQAADFRANAAALRSTLDQLDKEYADGLKTCQRNEIVTSHAAFGYLADRYHLQQVAITGLSPEEEPSPERLAEVAKEAKAHNTTTIFFETLVSPKLSEAVAKEIGAKTAVLDPIEGIEPGSNSDYLSVMRTNLSTLRTALGCT
jgi:zinc transport system substrate-binding protein